MFLRIIINIRHIYLTSATLQNALSNNHCQPIRLIYLDILTFSFHDKKKKTCSNYTEFALYRICKHFHMQPHVRVFFFPTIITKSDVNVTLN